MENLVEAVILNPADTLFEISDQGSFAFWQSAVCITITNS